MRSAAITVSDVTSCKRSDGFVAGIDPARIQGTSDVRTARTSLGVLVLGARNAKEPSTKTPRGHTTAMAALITAWRSPPPDQTQSTERRAPCNLPPSEFSRSSNLDARKHADRRGLYCRRPTVSRGRTTCVQVIRRNVTQVSGYNGARCRSVVNCSACRRSLLTRNHATDVRAVRTSLDLLTKCPSTRVLLRDRFQLRTEWFIP